MNKKFTKLVEAVNSCARTSLKMAAIGGEQDAPFEQAFSNLAHAYLQDKAPNLIDYEVGFQLLDRNQENTKAVGVFGFKVGPQWLYAPVFFLNGDLKGHELLYIKNQDMFVPLKENWLNYILNRKPSVLGKEVDKNLHQQGVMPPNLFQLSRSPNKFASTVEKMSPWVKQILPAYAGWVVDNPGNSKKYASMTSLPDFLKREGFKVITSLIGGFKQNPKLASIYDDFHGLKTIDDAIAEVSQKIIEQRSNSVLKIAASNKVKCVSTTAGIKCMNQVPTKKRLTGSVLDSNDGSNVINVQPGDLLKTAAGEPLDKDIVYAQQKPLKIYIYDHIMQKGTGLEDLSDKEREKLMRDRVLIKDNREDGEVNKAYEVNTTVKLQNPSETGLYDVLVKSNKFEKCLVVIGPYTNKGTKDFATVVKLEGSDSGRSWINTHASNVFIRHQYSNEEFQDWFKSLKEADSLTVSKTGVCLIIGNTGQGTTPFKVTSEVSDSDRKIYDVYFKDHASKGRADHLPPVRSRENVDTFMHYVGERITFTGKRGARLRSNHEDLYVPNDYKILELKPDKDEESDDSGYACCSPCESSDPPALEPGNQLDIDLMIGTKTASIKIYDSGTEVEINGKRMQKLSALTHLVKDFKLRESQSRLLLKRATDKKVARFRIKKAGPEYDLQKSNLGAPSFPELPTGYDPGSGGVPTSMTGEWNVPIPELSSSNTDRSNFDPMGPDPDFQSPPDQQAQQSAMQAAQLGQKEVFDTSMIGSLLKTVRDDSMIDKYMGDLMKGLDRLGRILFLYYWHNEKFADRYGKDEMVELEDGIRNAFEYLGDIVLFLKQRAIENDFIDNQDINLSEVS